MQLRNSGEPDRHAARRHPLAFDPDFGKQGFARDLFRLRFRRFRIEQPAFAERFGLTFGMIKDQEQARARPSKAFKVLVAAIELDPALIERAARIAEDRWPDEPVKTGDPQ